MRAARSEQTPGRHSPSLVSASIRSAEVSTVYVAAPGPARACGAPGAPSAKSDSRTQNTMQRIFCMSLFRRDDWTASAAAGWRALLESQRLERGREPAVEPRRAEEERRHPRGTDDHQAG